MSGIPDDAMPGVDFVSPLPPVRSGIADYSCDLLPYVAEHCDLQVVALPGQEIEETLRRRWRPVEVSELGRDGRVPLYQMGNNRHHEEVRRLALQHPGIVTMHDLVMHHLLVELTLGREDFDSYKEELVQDHGWIGELVANARWWGELAASTLFELPANRRLLRAQRGVLVHSHWAARQIGEEEEDVAVAVVPMAVPLPERVAPEEAAEFRLRYRLPSEDLLIGSFGFQTPIKRTEVAIRALAHPALASAHLLIAGEVAGVLDYEGLAEELGVRDRVHVTGFLDYSDFERAITACDVCLNLRYPTAGETSASLLRVLALGRPAVVSDFAQFAELPDEVAIKVPLGEGEAEALAHGVAEVLEDRGRLAAMGRAARDFVRRHHDPSTAGRAVAEAVADLAQRLPPAETSATVPPPTTLLWQDFPGRLAVSGAEVPWVEGERRELTIELENTGVATWLATKEKPGGVILDLQWRPGIRDEAVERAWAELPTALAGGGGRTFRVALRRPRGGRFLVIEPHIEDLAGLSAFGGPSWVGDYGA